jgi:hypothetical protein
VRWSGDIINWRSGVVLVVIAVTTWVLVTRYNFTWFPEVIVAWGTIVLAYATFRLGQTTREENRKLVAQNQRLAEESRTMREQDRELDSKRRRLDEVQQWIERVLEFKSKHSVITIGQEEKVGRLKDLMPLLAPMSYILLEAQRLDSELKGFSGLVTKHKKGLEDLIKELSSIFTKELQPPVGEYMSASAMQNIENNCVAALSIISDLRAELKL